MEWRWRLLFRSFVGNLGVVLIVVEFWGGCRTAVNLLTLGLLHYRFFIVRMLAVFHPTVASPPEEIAPPEHEAAGQTDTAGILKAYKKVHNNAITIEFGKRCAMGYSHDQQELLRPRYGLFL